MDINYLYDIAEKENLTQQNINIFSSNLSYLLKQYNITQRALAQAINTTEVTISRYLSNERQPRTDIIRKIAEYFNVDIDSLINTPLNFNVNKVQSTFSNNIKKLRELKKWKQDTAAKVLGISVPALSRYESGLCEPKNLDLLVKFSTIYDITIDVLLKVDTSEHMDQYDEIGNMIHSLSNSERKEVEKFIKFIKSS